MYKTILTGALFISANSFSATPDGEYLSRVADCAACHTKEGGESMAGGKKFHTPLGDIYSTNITPDSKEGIGSYSYDEFEQAVRRGIAPGGRALYPAMPYPSYSKMTDEDIHQLYSYFMHEVKPSGQKNLSADIPWLFSPRWPLRIWNWMFTDKPANTAKTPVGPVAELIQRGKYLVEGPGHCGACHTPRGIAQQEKAYDSSDAAYLSGAMIDGWFAPSLRNSTVPDEELKDLLQKGRSKHSAITGPMAEVVTQSTQYLTNNDLTAITAYLSSLDNTVSHAGQKVPATVSAHQPENRAGKTLYFRYCSTCHDVEGKGTDYNIPSLINNSSVEAEDPANLIRVIAFGAETPVTQGNIPYKMPAYHGQLNAREMRDIVNYVRGEWSVNQQPVEQQQIEAVINKGH